MTWSTDRLISYIKRVIEACHYTDGTFWAFSPLVGPWGTQRGLNDCTTSSRIVRGCLIFRNHISINARMCQLITIISRLHSKCVALLSRNSWNRDCLAANLNSCTLTAMQTRPLFLMFINVPFPSCNKIFLLTRRNYPAWSRLVVPCSCLLWITTILYQRTCSLFLFLPKIFSI